MEQGASAREVSRSSLRIIDSSLSHRFEVLRPYLLHLANVLIRQTHLGRRQSHIDAKEVWLLWNMPRGKETFESSSLSAHIL